MAIAAAAINIIGGSSVRFSVERCEYRFNRSFGPMFSATILSPQGSSQASEEVEMSLSQRINILVVEDSESDATFILHGLEQSSLPENIHRVPTGEEALAVLNADGRENGTPRPHLILLDLNLPGLDGFDILKTIKANHSWKTIPVIIVSSSALKEDIQRARQLKADLYLTKPFDLDGYSELAKTLEEFWNNSPANADNID
ncbi:MAG TPA: response regulator [Pirellulales bacterium]|nr:response regulator [Pirellulales bacterium]